MTTPADFWRRPIVGHPRPYDPWRDAGEDYVFVESVADAVCAYWESTFTLRTGKFDGRPFTLQDWQRQIVGHLFGWKPTGWQDTPERTRRYRTLFLYVPKKNGKCLDVETPIATPAGWIRLGDLRAGDTIFADTGRQCRVVRCSEVYTDNDCYRVDFSDGAHLVVDGEHRWRVYCCKDSQNSGRRVYKIKTTEQMVRDWEITDARGRTYRNYSVDVAGALDCEVRDLPIHPYVLGVWLGDGSSSSAIVYFEDKEIAERIKSVGEPCRETRVKDGGCPAYSLSDGVRRSPGDAARECTMSARLRALGLFGNKHIPLKYKRSSIDQRMELLRGLMDTDGTCSKAGQCSIDLTNKALADDVAELIRSLGFKVTRREKQPTINGSECGTVYCSQFWAFADRPVFHLERKRDRQKASTGSAARSTRRQIVGISRVARRPVMCIEVDSPSHMYLAGSDLVPTHNTQFGAGLGLLLLMADGEPGAEVYSCAASSDQARIVYDAATSMIKHSRQLSRSIRIFRGYRSMVCAQTNSTWRVLSSSADTKHGPNVHGLLIDELHTQTDDELIETLEAGTVARTRPLIVKMTTAGHVGESPVNRELDYARSVRDGGRADARYMPIIFDGQEDDRADPERWKSPEFWPLVNPSFGLTIGAEYYEAEVRRCADQPSRVNAFKRLHLNIQTEFVDSWFDGERWRACAGVVDRRGPLFAALDLASTTDLCALAMYWPDTRGLDCLFFAPEETIERYPEYVMWRGTGHLIQTPGAKTDYAAIRDAVIRLRDEYDLRQVGYDPWNGTHLARELADEHEIEMVEFRQGTYSMNAPSKAFEVAVIGGELVHSDNPVLNWMAGNVAIKTDAGGNIRPCKPNRSRDAKIDGIVASIMAKALAEQAPKEEDNGPYIYVS